VDLTAAYAYGRPTVKLARRPRAPGAGAGGCTQVNDVREQHRDAERHRRATGGDGHEDPAD
jgi:hypothetical protein